MQDIGRIMRPVQRKISQMVGRAVLRALNDGTGTQTMQVELLKDELYDGVERFQEYGFTSVPHAGAEVVMVSVGGQRGHGVVVACADKRYRITGLEDGEVSLYTDEDLDGGHRIHLKRNKEVEILSDTTASILQTPTKTTVSNDTEIEAVSGTAYVNIKPGKIEVKNGTTVDIISGTSSVKVTPSSITLTVGAQVVVLNASGLFHNGINIGATHIHYYGTDTNGNTGAPVP